ncbi:polysaccharide pyruvyl transferase family protein [Comamonas sp. HJ-2]
MRSAPLKIGAFGTGNLGDDLMLHAILKEEPESNVVAYGPPCLPFEVRYIPTNEFLDRPDRYLSIATSLDFGGGNLFWSAENVSDMLVISQRAKIAGLPVRLQRIGLQGFECSPRYVKALLAVVDSLTVRDRQSLDIARQLGREDCEYSRDYAFELLENFNLPSSNKKDAVKRVGINFADTRFTSEDPQHRDFILHISGIFSELARNFQGSIEFCYIPFSNHRTHIIENDLRAGAILWEASGGLIKYAENIYTTEDLVREVHSVDVLLGTRFHMQVLGYALKKEVVPLVANFLERSKYNSISRDNGVEPIPYSGVSQGFTISKIKNRLSNFFDKKMNNKNESN